jgi:hypothetical protein
VNAAVRSAAAAAALLALCGSVSCAPALGDGEQSAADRPVPGAADRQLVPPGYGTLRQDDVTVPIRAGALLVKLTPLDEATIRLLAPDTYMRLRALRESRLEEASRAVSRAPELFLVSFFSYQPDMAFQPEDVQLLHQARLLRAAAILPVTTGWGRQQLAQQETQMALYVFPGPIDYQQSMTVRYGLAASDEWRQIVERLESERAKVQSRVR